MPETSGHCKPACSCKSFKIVLSPPHLVLFWAVVACCQSVFSQGSLQPMALGDDADTWALLWDLIFHCPALGGVYLVLPCKAWKLYFLYSETGWKIIGCFKTYR